VSFAIVLLQAAFASNRLDEGEPYGNVLPELGNRLRMLISKSDADFALRNAYPLAQLMDIFQWRRQQKQRSVLLDRLRPLSNLSKIRYNWKSSGATSSLVGKASQLPSLLVADLTPLHTAPQNDYNGGLAGHHSDIFRDEIYSLMAWFLFG
jgi:hypothetical protein